MAPESKQGLRTWLWTRKGSITTKRSWFRGAKRDRKSTRLNSSHLVISYAVFCLKKKNEHERRLVTGPISNVYGWRAKSELSNNCRQMPTCLSYTICTVHVTA